jgi:bifunctional non-homologous end joining protein LigD
LIDGEIICLGPDGKSQFYDLFFRRAELSFVAFDLVRCDGQDYTYAPLIERKHKLRSILPKKSQSIFFCDHVERNGEELFRLACANDLEGIVAKHRFGPYLQQQAQWLKIRNTQYSQWVGRERLFEKEREVDPDASIWDTCVLEPVS